MNRLILFYLALNASVALGFPELIRKGYTSCTSCHISPSGGGVLNEYGRGMSEEVLSTYQDNSKLPTYGLDSFPKWLSLGGDVRYVNVTAESYKSKFHRHFLMQSDFELAISPIPGLTVASAIGFYDVNFPEKNYKKIEAEQRRNYVLLDINPSFSLRVGRFTPAYGINFPDHTLPTRGLLGLGEGRETYNVEANIKTKMGEIFLTGINGSSGTLSASNQGYQWSGEGESGFSAKISSFYFKNSQVGLSAFRLRSPTNIRTAYGGYFVFGMIPFFSTLAEIDQHVVIGQNRETVWLVKQNFEPFQGLNFSVSYEGARSLYSDWRYALQLFPISHLELLAEYQRRVPYPAGVLTEMWTVLLHWYF